MALFKVDYSIYGAAQEYLSSSLNNEYIIDSDVLKKISGHGSRISADLSNKTSCVITQDITNSPVSIANLDFFYIKNTLGKAGVKLGLSLNNGSSFPIELDTNMIFLSGLDNVSVQFKSLISGKVVPVEYIYIQR